MAWVTMTEAELASEEACSHGPIVGGKRALYQFRTSSDSQLIECVQMISSIEVADANNYLVALPDVSDINPF